MSIPAERKVRFSLVDGQEQEWVSTSQVGSAVRTMHIDPTIGPHTIGPHSGPYGAEPHLCSDHLHFAVSRARRVSIDLRSSDIVPKRSSGFFFKHR
jgi:hypothetical protein